MNRTTKIREPLCAVIFGCCITAAVQGYTPIFKNTHVLTSGSLSVEVMDPTAADRQDHGVRFSPMAWVIQANAGDVNYFYAPANPTDAPWNSNPDRYPFGSPMEFDLGDFDVRPPGFDQPAERATDEFVKIGVGILQRTVSGNYNLGKDYQFVAGETTVTWESDRANFRQTLPRESNTGYRYELETTMRVVGNQMHLEYEMTNNGSRAFQTTQYLHNFTSIDGASPNMHSEVEVPWSFTAEGNLSQVLRQEGNKLVYLNGITRSRKPVIPVDNIADAPFEVIVRQKDRDEHYSFSADLPDSVAGATAEPLAVAIWNDNGGIQFSPEQFVLLSIDPGNTISWSRSYTFGNVPEPATWVLGLGAGLLVFAIRRRSTSQQWRSGSWRASSSIPTPSLREGRPLRAGEGMRE